jgi:hypothetical protein
MIMPTKSGASWISWADTNAANSHDVELLAEPFRSDAKAFIAALRQAGATVNVTATKRSSRRAYLFHWSWKISLGKCKPSEAAAMTGVDIQWDHADDLASTRGAREMVTGFGLAVPPKSINAPALTSNHIVGTAIDMDIIWTGTIKVKNKQGQEVAIPFMRDVNANTLLHAVGESYGVRKLVTDAPHWSQNGR